MKKAGKIGLTVGAFLIAAATAAYSLWYFSTYWWQSYTKVNKGSLSGNIINFSNQ